MDNISHQRYGQMTRRNMKKVMVKSSILMAKPVSENIDILINAKCGVEIYENEVGGTNEGEGQSNKTKNTHRPESHLDHSGIDSFTSMRSIGVITSARSYSQKYAISKGEEEAEM
jgi:hypothetical protein